MVIRCRCLCRDRDRDHGHGLALVLAPWGLEAYLVVWEVAETIEAGKRGDDAMDEVDAACAQGRVIGGQWVEKVRAGCKS